MNANSRPLEVETPNRGHLLGICVGVLVVIPALIAGAVSAEATAETPAWAFPVSPPLVPVEQIADAEVPHSLSGTQSSFTKAQLRDLYAAPDWRPQSHPPMPPVVATGRRPGVFACAYCHQPNGVGRPENANLTGLGAAYMLRQISDYRQGHRKTSVPDMLPQILMAKEAVQTVDADMQSAVAYFASLPVRSNVTVVESDTVPESEARAWALVPKATGGREPLGTRIVELPVDPIASDLRDPDARFVAYVPPGSLKAGKLVATGQGSTPACTACHGADLQGEGDAPRLAGRSPTYLARQLFDIRNGARAGPWVDQMRAVVATLSPREIIAVTAYAASLGQ